MPIQRITSGVIADGAIVATDIADGIVTGAKLASGAANTNIGYTAANKAGETFSGDVNISKSSPYLYVTSTGGTNQNIWFKDNANNTFAIESQPTAQGGVYISNRTATAPIYVRTSNAGGTLVTSMTLNQYGIGVGDATPSSGMGIKFPDTQSASSDANTLDDYEEGTWTPVNASIASITLSVTRARYVKIGRLVFITCYVNYPSTSDTNHAKIGGLPFTHIGDETYSYISGRTLYNGSKEPVYWQVQSGISEMAAYQSGAGNTVNNNDLSGGYVIFSGCYFAAA